MHVAVWPHHSRTMMDIARQLARLSFASLILGVRVFSYEGPLRFWVALGLYAGFIFLGRVFVL